MENYEREMLLKVMNERHLSALIMRRDGAVFRVIGEKLGVCAARAREIVYRAERKAKNYKDEFEQLSVRVLNVLKSQGLTTREDILSAVEVGLLNPNSKSIGNYGDKSHREVLDWLGIVNLCSSRELSKLEKSIQRRIKFLECNGFIVSRMGKKPNHQQS